MTLPLSPIDLTGGKILSDEVYTRIGLAIIDGTLPAGERVRDVDLAEQLGVSRTPVREALQRLERFGLVEVVVGKYTRVTEPTERLRKETGELTAYVMATAMRIALQRCSDDDLADILAAADVVIDTARSADATALFSVTTAMFEVVTRSTGNAALVRIMREASFAIQRNLRGWEPYLSSPLTRLETYSHLRSLIAARDADGAEQALRAIHGLA